MTTAECTITPAPPDSLSAGTSASSKLLRKACKDVTSSECVVFVMHCLSACDRPLLGGIRASNHPRPALRTRPCRPRSLQPAPHCWQQEAAGGVVQRSGPEGQLCRPASRCGGAAVTQRRRFFDQVTGWPTRLQEAVGFKNKGNRAPWPGARRERVGAAAKRPMLPSASASIVEPPPALDPAGPSLTLPPPLPQRWRSLLTTRPPPATPC